MVQFIITIVERDGVATVQVSREQQSPTELEIAVLEQECRMGFTRHSGSIQKLAIRSLKQFGPKNSPGAFASHSS